MIDKIKCFLKSIKTHPTIFPSFIAFNQESIIRIRADSVECFGRNPLCDLCNKLKLSKYLKN